MGPDGPKAHVVNSRLGWKSDASNKARGHGLRGSAALDKRLTLSKNLPHHPMIGAGMLGFNPLRADVKATEAVLEAALLFYVQAAEEDKFAIGEQLIRILYELLPGYNPSKGLYVQLVGWSTDLETSALLRHYEKLYSLIDQSEPGLSTKSAAYVILLGLVGLLHLARRNKAASEKFSIHSRLANDPVQLVLFVLAAQANPGLFFPVCGTDAPVPTASD